MLAVEDVFEGDLLAGMGSHAAHARDEARLGAPFGFVAGWRIDVDLLLPDVATRAVS